MGRMCLVGYWFWDPHQIYMYTLELKHFSPHWKLELNFSSNPLITLKIFLRTTKPELQQNYHSQPLRGKFMEVRAHDNTILGLPGGSDRKEFPYNAGDLGSIPGSGRSPREGNDNPVQYSCLENPMVRRAWQTRSHRVTESRTGLKRLGTLHLT